MASSNDSNNNQSELLNKLVESIKKCKFDRNIVTNLSCYYIDRLLVWNDDDQCIYGCLFDDRYNITAIQIITLSSLPTFQINEICLNPQENYLAIYGKNGCMIVELPRNWSYCRTATTTTTTSETLIDKVDPKQKQQQTTSKLLIRSFSLAERMFLTNRNLKLECLRWHPISKRHLIILTNDNRLRLFDIFNEYEPIKTVHLGNDYNSGLYSGALGENAVSFDFGPSLSQYHNNNNNLSMTMKELIDIYSIFVLKENGDVLLLYLNLKDLTTFYCQHQPLKMLPAAEDNYGSEACSILCLDCVPPIIIIGTCSGLLYHCLAIENDLNNNDDNCDNSSYQISTSKSTIIIPETVLNVFETIELSFPLATYQIMDNGQYNDDMDTISTALNLIADPKDGQRYYCQHSYGVHCVMVPFFKQIVNPIINNEFYDDKAIVEYLICTRPTIDNEQQQQSQSNDCPTFPVGIGLTIKYGFTSITVILNTGELISKRLSNIVLSDVDDDEQNEISRLINLTESPSFGLQQQAKKPNFSEHIQRLLTKTTSLPLIKSSKTDSKCGMAELEMLLNSIDVLRNEYLDKYFLAAKAIDKRKTVLNIEIDVQLNQLDQHSKEKDEMLNKYVELIEKYEQIRETTNFLTERLENIMTTIQKQRPEMSNAELHLREQLMKELQRLDEYREQFELVQQKRRYQDMQMQKYSLQQQQQSSLIANDDDSLDESHLQSPTQLKNIKQILANQSKEITGLIAIINTLKKKTINIS
ncbi:DNA polymerase delta interacting protein 2 isoform X1 [Dermatophagoides pteronyssinus]|uniref:DNA polymerase delta interacting protein 2 isoform X1 n=1 Tax=Dermatophagoides pteronyssinus TaxID=6956 RepID=UPI003F662CCF